MHSLLKNIRFYILLISIILSIIVFFSIITFVVSTRLQIIRLNQLYGLCAFLYLYLALLASPICRTFPTFPWKEQYLKARRAIGVSAFYFALLHALIAFFGQLGGFPGLTFLSERYVIAILLGFICLFILFLLAITSFDTVIDKVGFKRWKTLHRFVYIAGIFLLIHALMLGTHFSDLSSAIPQLMFSLISILFILEAYQTDKLLKSKLKSYPQYGLIFVMVTAVISVGIFIYTVPPNNSLSLGIHAQHIQIAKDAQQELSLSNPSLQGDKTKRYTVSFKTIPEEIVPEQDVIIEVKVYDASSGTPTKLFKVAYEKLMHMIIVDDNLNHFSHIHPVQSENMFSITTKFPKDGKYHIYVDYQPYGAIEQQQAFSLLVGNDSSIKKVSHPDTSLNKVFGDYKVQLKGPATFSSKNMSVGEQSLVFSLSNKDGHPITTLKPYLGAFGHLVMINEKTFDYIHVHPTKTAPSPLSTSGPDVEFMPIGLYGPIKPGTYRVFAQFNPDGKLFTADFTITIK